MPEPPPSTDIACDALVVGGGINGVGIARDLAGRGLSVVLAEKDDLASHTSSGCRVWRGATVREGASSSDPRSRARSSLKALGSSCASVRVRE